MAGLRLGRAALRWPAGGGPWRPPAAAAALAEPPRLAQLVAGPRHLSSGSGGAAMASSATSEAVVPLCEVKRFMADCLKAVDTCESHAVAMAELLAAADYRGHYSHGMNRLDMYVRDVQSGTCSPNAVPAVLRESPSTAWVDGQNGLGAVVGDFCMRLAISKARLTGVGWVAARASNHYGIAGYYSQMALDQGLLGMTFTNTSPLMCPTGAKDAALGTNPLSLFAPGEGGDSFQLDMATTAVAVGKIEMQVRKQEPLPEGWAKDPAGHPTTDGPTAFSAGRLQPLGGDRLTSGYKGYGLGLLVEVFCGVLAGSKFGPQIRKWKDPAAGPADLGQGFVALDPGCFAPGFESRMSELMDHLRNMEPVDPEQPVLVAGDPERAHMRAVDAQGGIKYHANQLRASEELAKELSVAPMKAK